MDEIHGANRDELAQLAASVQHFIRAGLPVALVFAGLPAAVVSDLLDEGVATSCDVRTGSICALRQ